MCNLNKKKKDISMIISLILLLNVCFSVNIKAAAVNDYTQWKQYDSEWNQAEAWPASQYPNATARWMRQAGCVVTSIAMLLRHYNVVTTSDVNQFNPWICNTKLRSVGALDSAADIYWGLNNAYPGFEYQNTVAYSLNTLKSLYSQGYACLVKVNGSGGYYHYVAVRSISGNTVTIMDPGSEKTLLSQYSSQYQIVYYKVSGRIDSVPIGCFDSADGGANSIYVRGWAFDPDDTSASLNIHIYVDGKHIDSCIANQPRGDVDNVYGCGEYHGFEKRFTYNVSSTSTHKIEVFALNTNTACANTLLNNSPKEVIVQAAPPVISNIKIKNITKSGYDIECKATSTSGVDRVQFPTWTLKNGQDDLDHDFITSSKSAGTKNGDIYSFHVNTADHNNETGTYFTHIYAYGKNGSGEHSVGAVVYIPTEKEYGYEPLYTTEYNGHTYLLFKGNFDPNGNPNATWTEAAAYSQSIGGYLACITSQEENNVVHSMVSEYGDKCWLGGNDLAKEGTFVWESGESFAYANWGSSQPDNYGAGQDYTLMYVENGQWDDEYNDRVHAFICEIPHTHTYSSTITKEATCTADGVKTFTCACGSSYTEKITKLGHNYVATLVDATCKDYASTVYTCSRCKDTYSEVHDAEYSQWSTTYPEGIDSSLIESRTEYRYQTKETKTSYSTSLSGWTQSGGTWENSGSGTMSYVSSWPAGFSTSHSLYGTYSKTPKSASETTTAKTVINSTATEGYLYYHWCRNTYAGGPANRTTSPVSSGEFNCFHAFYSTTNPNSLTASSDGDGSRIFSNGDCCVDTYWYYPVTVNKQTYTTYKKLFNYYRWTDWSEWSTEKTTQSSSKNVETRTVYRYATPVFGEHTYGEWKVIKAATDLVEGLRERTCLVCNEKEQEVIPKLDHTHKHIESITKAATCTAAGVKTFTCECGNTYTETIKALGHNVGSWKIETAASCTENGLKVKECSRLGCTYRESEVIASTGHAYGSWTTVKAATDLVEGLKERSCINCGNKEQQVIPKLDHEHSYSFVITKAATCTEDGVKTFTCTCKDTYTEKIQATGHVMGNWEVEKEATCVEDGLKVKKCIKSGCSHMENEVISATGHFYGGWTVVKKPTDREEGIQERICANCKEKETQTIGKLDHVHSYYLESTIEATCDAPGSKLYVCQCDEDTRDTYTESIAPLGHVLGQWKVEKEPTCAVEGLKVKTCYRDNCEYKELEIIPAVGHTYGEWTVVEEPTIKEEGVKVRICANCEYSEYGIIEKLEEQEPVLNNPFTDVKETDYYYAPVVWAFENKITTGISATIFDPNANCTRGQVVTFLWRVAGCQEPEIKEATFKDVPVNSYYYKPILWAVENNISSGYNAETFGPEDQVTRGQFVSLLWRMQGNPEPSSVESDFTDLPDYAYYYKAVLWAAENKIAAGYGEGTFAPDVSCTRGQVVSFLYRAYE